MRAIAVLVVAALAACGPQPGNSGTPSRLADAPVPSAALTPVNLTSLGEFGDMVGEFEAICMRNLTAPSAAVRTARSRGYKPFLLPGFLQKSSDGYAALIVAGGKNERVCQVQDSTIGPEGADRMLQSYLSAKFPAFDPGRRETDEQGGKFLVDLGGSTYGFYAGAKKEEGRANKRRAGIGVSLVR